MVINYESTLYDWLFLMAVIRKLNLLFSNDRFGIKTLIVLRLLCY